jgi:hypothetical protein
MPLERYGVLKGTVVDARREDNPDTPTTRCMSALRAQATASRSMSSRS